MAKAKRVQSKVAKGTARRPAKARQRAAATPAAPAAVTAQIDAFLARYTPEVEQEARLARTAMRGWMPAAVEMIYDNYQFLVFGYGPSERAGQAVLSLALAPRWVTLCFLQGAQLDDPHGLLQGSGSTVRHISLKQGVAQLREPEVEALIGQALARAKVPIPMAGAGTTVIKSISAKQRPRRPR